MPFGEHHLSYYSLDISLSAPAARAANRLTAYNRYSFLNNLIITLKIALAEPCSSVDVVFTLRDRQPENVPAGGAECTVRHSIHSVL